MGNMMSNLCVAHKDNCNGSSLQEPFFIEEDEEVIVDLFSSQQQAFYLVEREERPEGFGFCKMG